MSGRIPEKTQEHTAPPVAKPKVEKPAPPPPKKINCFVMVDKPEKPGLILVSTGKVQDGCFILGWQQQSSTWLVSEGTMWYPFASKLLKVNLAFTSVFALALLLVLYIRRGP